MPLVLDIVSPKGVVLHEEGLDAVVVRRREARFEPGSEVAILPRHGRLLMQTQPCRLRFDRDATCTEVEAGAGVLEVIDDRVTLALTGAG